MSRKLTVFRLVSMVIFNPMALKVLVMSFLILSDLLPVMFLKAASPSSLYRPMFSLPYFLANLCSMNIPTSTHISAPSLLPIVTSNDPLPFFFTHGFVLSKRRDFRACMIICLSSSDMVVYWPANLRDSNNNFSVMDG